MRSLALFFILLVLTLLPLGCGKKGGAVDGDTIKIGVIAELTGDTPAVGASCKNAAELAVAQLNAAGGIELGGQKTKVEPIVRDNAGRTDQATLAAQKLISEENVLAIIGPNASGYAIPVSAIAESNKVVMITPWSTSPPTTVDARTGQPKRYVFRACFIDPFQGRVVARFVRENLKAAKAAVLFDVTKDYNKGIAEYFKKTFTDLGGQVVAFETYSSGDKDFSAQLTKIKAAAPDVIFLPNYYNEVPLQVRQAHRLGITVPFVGSDSWGNPDLLKAPEDARELEGFYFSTHYAPDIATPAAKEFIAAYTAKYGNTPDDVAALTYDACGLLFKAIAAAGKADREAVRDALAKITDFQGVTGEMKFQGTGDPVKSAVILQIKGGKFAWFANAKP